jgi:hypothetical protein
MLSLPGVTLPDVDPARVASVGPGAMVIRVRHAQDIDAERFEGDWDWATTTFHIRSLAEAEDPRRQIVADVSWPTHEERITLGDADGELVIPCPSTTTRVVVSVDAVDAAGGPDVVWVDLVAG